MGGCSSTKGERTIVAKEDFLVSKTSHFKKGEVYYIEEVGDQ